MQHYHDDVQRIIATALQEDIGKGDVTSAALLPEYVEITLHVVPREPIVVSGIHIAGRVFEAVDAGIDFIAKIEDGSDAQAGEVIATVTGNASALLTAERVALNLLQRMCGIASETARYVEAVRDTNCKILDTRKTMPGLRVLDKYAVRCGGGQNHRMRLDDMVLIKDNHIAIIGSLREAVLTAKARCSPNLTLVVECDTLDQVREALEAGADRVLLDNMSLQDMREAVLMAKGKAPLEASGGMSLERVAEVAATGVDYISVGALTHSVRAADIGLDAV